MSYSYNCTNCNKQIFLDNDAVEVQKNHICAGIEHATNLILSENGISYKCKGCLNYIGDEFNGKLLIRKDLVTRVLVVQENENSSLNASEVHTQIQNLQNNVDFLKQEQKEIKKALLLMKDSFENQLVDIKRSILHLANELQKLQ